MPFRSLTTETATRFAGEVVPRSSPSLGRTFSWHNWNTPFGVTTSYQKEVVFGTYQADEEFVALQVRPTRTFAASYLEGAELGPYLEQFLASSSPRTNQTFVNQTDYLLNGLNVSWKLPLECDATKLSNVDGGGTLYGDFTNRRFYVGAEVFIAPPARGKILLGGDNYLAVTATIEALTDTTMDISAPTSPDDGWFVMPVVDCVPNLQVNTTYLTSKIVEVELQGLEYPGISALPPSLIKGEIPSGIGTFRDATFVPRMVFAPDQNWAGGMEVSLVRSGTDGDIPRLAGGRPYWKLTVSDRTFSRAEWWTVLQMYDSHSGGAKSMWVVDPRVLTKNADRGALDNSIVLPEMGLLDEFLELTPAVAYKLADGSWHISEIDKDAATGWDIPLLNSLEGTGALGCVHRAFVGRFDGPFDESWLSWDLCDVSFEIIQTDGSFPNEIQVP